MRRISIENFYVRSSLFTLLSLAGALINYSLYPVLAHIFNTNDFGNFAVIIALSNQITGILLAFNLISIYLVKNYPEDEARQKAQTIQKILIWVFLGLSLVLALCSPFIGHWLHVSDTYSFIALTALLLLAVPSVVWTGYLQGHKQLIAVGWFTFLTAIFKLILGISLGYVFGVRGGLLGIVLGAMAGLIALRLIARIRLPALSSLSKALKQADRDFVRQQRMFILSSILIVGMLSILQNIDITFAKAFFAPSVAGTYSGISILSNALYYASFLLVWIILPEISHNSTHNRQLLRTAYTLLLGLAVMVAGVELLFRNILARLLLGESFASQGGLLVYASLFQLSLIAVTLYTYYLLILRKRQAAVLACSTFVASIAIPRLLSPKDPRALILLLIFSVLVGWLIYSLIILGLHITKRTGKTFKPTNIS
jgi:O-antigen/teichoic acid export membrane protein